MYSIVNSLRVTPRLSGVIARNRHTVIVSTPPTVKVSIGEKFFALFCIAGAILGVPMYLAPKFRTYADQRG